MTFRYGLLYAFLLTLAAGPVAAQTQTATLRGFVTDASDGQALQGASIGVEDAEGRLYGAATNADGFFAVARLPAGSYRLRASFVGYTSYADTLRLEPAETRILAIALEPSEAGLGEVVVETERTGGAANLTAGLQSVTPAEIERIPLPDVSGDLASYLTTLPGVVSTGDQGGQFFIRGGEPSQNLVLLDGMLVYQPFHILGFYSAFPSDILSRADLYAGAYGAAYGGRLSSVIDVTTRNGNKKAFAAMASVAPFVSAARLEGPLVDDRVSLLASGRLSTIEQGAAALVDQDLPFTFGDVFAKVHARLNRANQLSLTTLYTHDRGVVGQQTPGADDEVRWTNTAGGIRYLFLPSRYPVLGNLQFTVSRLQTELGPTARPDRSADILRFNTETDVTYFTGPVDVRWGLFARTLRLASRLGGLYQNVETEEEFLTEVGLFIEPEIRLGRAMTLRPALRIHNFPSKRKAFAEPRFRALWTRGRHQVSAAAGLYHQEIVGLTDRRDVTGVFTAWTAVPIGEVPRALHVLAGYRLRPAPWLELSAEGFYKHIDNLFVSEWTAFPRLTTRLQQASGRVRGLDLRLEARRGPLYAFLGYGLSSVTYTAMQETLELWFGETTLRYRPAHDRRHTLNAVVSASRYGFDLSVRWQLSSGLPFSRALGFDSFVLMSGDADVFEEGGQRRVIYERPFNGTLPAYHRLDVSLERSFTLGRTRLTAQAGVINLYDRANLFYYDTFTLQRVDQLPLIPSFGLKVEV